KVEAGKIELVCEDFPVSDAINAVRILTASIAAKKSIVVDLSVDEGLTTIHADEGKFKQILYNLLSNAIKFTPEHGSVTVGARQSGNMAEISVTDTGIGISEENQKKLFQPFMQADASTSREYGGTGLGLSLVKKFSELHGGTAWAESELGKGSTFTFTIPIEGGAEAETEAEVTEEDVPEEDVPEEEVEVAAEVEMPEKMHEVPAVKETVTAEELAAIEIPEIIEPAGGSGDEPLILVLEDDISSSELLTVTLTGAGYRVIPAYDGREALAVAKKLKPFAITLDIMLPGMDGWDVLKYLKYDPETSNIPVIVVSMLDEAEVGFSLGVVDYFVKPVEKNTFITALNNLKESLGIDMPKVLVVDDDPDAVELVASMIEPAGFEVIRAYGGEEGIDKSFSEHPNVLILDLMMPDVSGFDVVSRLKTDPETSNIPIIICTSRDPTSKDIIRLRSDVISVMCKGKFAREELINEIKKVAKLVRR
ncbi:hybrid sensor histidine kinase/response regulator, partial [Candidatus Fermentibacteria bacterium]